MPLIIAHIGSRQFSWNRDTKTFSVDASELRYHGQNFLGRVYEDACDSGFVMVSARSGQHIVFTLECEHRNVDGDVTHWTFEPEDVAKRSNSDLEGVSVIVWNT